MDSERSRWACRWWIGQRELERGTESERQADTEGHGRVKHK